MDRDLSGTQVAAAEIVPLETACGASCTQCHCGCKPAQWPVIQPLQHGSSASPCCGVKQAMLQGTKRGHLVWWPSSTSASSSTAHAKSIPVLPWM